MKRAEVQLPDPLYQKVEGLAAQLHLSVPEVLHRAVEQLVRRESKPSPATQTDWRFPEGQHLGTFQSPATDWRELANETSDR